MALAIPNVVPGCSLQVIDNSTFPPRWKVLVANMIDAPNPIKAEMKRLGLKSAWVRDFMGERRIVNA